LAAIHENSKRRRAHSAAREGDEPSPDSSDRALQPDALAAVLPVERWLALAYFALYWAYLFWHQENELWHWVTLVVIPLLLTLALRAQRPFPVTRTLASFGLLRGNLTRGLWVTLALGVVIGFTQTFLSRSGPAVVEAFTSGRALYLVPLIFALLLVLTGFTEEFFFRGFLQTRLERLFRSRGAGLAGATLLFGLYHVPYAYFNPAWPSAGSWRAAFSTGLVEGALGGLVLGGLFLYTRRNLVMCIVLHALVDTFPGMAMIKFGGP